MAIARSPLAGEIRATLTVAAPLAAANIAQMAMHARAGRMLPGKKQREDAPRV